MIRARATLLAALFALAPMLLAACGQKGDLRLPVAKTRTAPAAPSQPAAPEAPPEPPASSPK